MLLAALFAVPIWLTVPAYFGLGAIWAFLYLPRAVTLQARKYREWKSQYIRDMDLKTALTTPWGYRKEPLAPAEFLRARKQHDFSERKVLQGFLIDIAFWPLMVLKFVVFEGIVIFFEKLDKFVRLFFEKLEIFFRVLWEQLIQPIYRWIRKNLRKLWNNLVVPVYKWVYARVVRVYQSIIQRANREAIADMEVLNRVHKEEKQ